MRKLMMVVAAGLGLWITADAPAQAQRVVRCESIRGTPERRVFCPMNTRRGVVVARQLSNQRCVRGQTYFVTQRGVTVRRGCRAVFESDRRPRR